MPKKLFQPGNCANPNGRPKKGDSWADAIRQAMDSTEIEIILTNTEGKEKKFYAKSHNGTIKNAVVGMLVCKALGGDVKAAEMMMDRTDGKPAQKVQIDAEEINPLLEKLNSYDKNTTDIDNPD